VDELPETYDIENIEQMRALADELRLRIIELLVQEPKTATQIGDALDVAPAKAHYHVRELERVGLLKLVFTREKGGILEKYYRAVAKNIAVPGAILQRTPPDEVLAAANEIAQQAIAGFLRAARVAIPMLDPAERVLGIGGASLWLTREEAAEFFKELGALFERHQQRRGIAGEREVTFFHIGYDARDAGEPEAPAAAPRPAPPSPPSPPSPRPPTPPFKGGRVWAAGMTGFSRADLEKVVARGERLDINVLGYVNFDGDIPPELADRAIARFRYRGVVTASPEVREVLKRKEQT